MLEELKLAAFRPVPFSSNHLTEKGGCETVQALGTPMMDDSQSEGLDQKIRTVLSQYPLVLMGYFFGSASTGRAGPMSDLDIAVLVSDCEARRTCEGEIADSLCRALHTDRIDFVSLATAPASLSYRVIREGRCVWCADRAARERFETNVVMRYLDFKPVREQAFRTTRHAILGAV